MIISESCYGEDMNMKDNSTYKSSKVEINLAWSSNALRGLGGVRDCNVRRVEAEVSHKEL